MRIFWLGMHKILVQTELPRLRSLGYEVFNPPYLSPIPDQSAQSPAQWNAQQPTSLPKDVFDKLAQTNFFYAPVPKEIGEILNKYFDAIIVTIHPLWLTEIAKVYTGKIIYRTYGQVETVSHELIGYQVVDNILARDNFFVVPHSLQTLHGEHKWFRNLAQVEVPYCITGDIFNYKNTYNWSNTNSNIMVGCPNIDNGFYWHHFNLLKKKLNDPRFNFYGVQLRQVYDSQLAGTIPREELIRTFQHSSSYFYTYEDPRVCYLPPIEMMIVGGPVVYLGGSLMDRYLNGVGSGRAATWEEGIDLCLQLSDKNEKLARKIVDEQRSVCEKYTPEYVWPKFDVAFKEILETNIKNPPKVKKWNQIETVNSSLVWSEGLSDAIVFDGENYFTRDSHVENFKAWISERKNYSIVCFRKDLSNLLGFFEKSCASFIIIDELSKDLPFAWVPLKLREMRLKISMKRVAASVSASKGFPHLATSINAPPSFLSYAQKGAAKFSSKKSGYELHIVLFVAFIFLRKFKKIVQWPKSVKAKIVPWLKGLISKIKIEILPLVQEWQIAFLRSRAIHLMNTAQNVDQVILPFYSKPVEGAQFKKPLSVFASSFLPQFYIETNKFGDQVGSAALGRMLLAKADHVYTVSMSAAKHLSESLLGVSLEKIKTFKKVKTSIVSSDGGKKESRPILLYPLPLSPENNHEVIFEALSGCESLKNYDLVVLTSKMTVDSKLILDGIGGPRLRFEPMTRLEQIQDFISTAALVLVSTEHSFTLPVELELAVALNKSILSYEFEALKELRANQALPQEITTLTSLLPQEWRKKILSIESTRRL